MTEHHTEGVKILAFVGLPGSGKSTAVDYVCKKGYPKVYFGGIMYDEMKKEGIEITPESQQKFREEWREREGKDVIVRRAIEQVRGLIAAGQRHILLDGVYSWTEYKILKREFPGEMTVVAIVAPKHIRHHRLNIRPERPFTNEEANTRDWSQIENLEAGGPIAIADHFLHNEGDIEKLDVRIERLLSDLNFTA
jgi:dephospho-CoA kinase